MDRTPKTANLPPGIHSYEDILGGVREGRYRFARLRTASGRLNLLIGVSPEQLKLLEEEARRSRLGFILLGSRVVGPRTRQRMLHPVLTWLPIKSSHRTPSPTYPGIKGVMIEKSAIKELGLENVHTSDLTVILVDPLDRDALKLHGLATQIEVRLRGLGCSFPIRVYPEVWGSRFKNEKDFLAFGEKYFVVRYLPKGHTFSPRSIERGLKELYATINLSKSPLGIKDVATGLWNGLLASLSFYMALKWHPAIFAVGFAYGFLGRYLARLKAWIARAAGDGFASNTAALGFDATLGTVVMAVVLSPAAGLGLSLRRIVYASALHALSKGSVRLWLDKIYSRGTDRTQAFGVGIASLVGFLQGLATAYVYAGSKVAIAIQVAVSATGLALVYQAPLSRLLRTLLSSRQCQTSFETGASSGPSPC